MSDPITASLQLAVSAVRAGAAIASWWDTRQGRKASSTETTSNGAYVFQMHMDKLFLVLATLGQRLLALGVVNHADLPEARTAVREAFRVGDSVDDLGEDFDKMSDTVQYAVTCAMVFCFLCYPMHMYRGFGCGVLDDRTWANPEYVTLLIASSLVFPDVTNPLKRVRNDVHDDTDRALAYLKSRPYEWQLITKSPKRISQTEVEWNKRPKELRKKMASIIQHDMVKEFEKKGFPQPLPPNDYIQISTWTVPFATWEGDTLRSIR